MIFIFYGLLKIEKSSNQNYLLYRRVLVTICPIFYLNFCRPYNFSSYSEIFSLCFVNSSILSSYCATNFFLLSWDYLYKSLNSLVLFKFIYKNLILFSCSYAKIWVSSNFNINCFIVEAVSFRNAVNYSVSF